MRIQHMPVDQTEISKKISKVLLILLFAFLLLLVRVAFLAFSDRDTALERAQKPQRRLVIDPAARAEISDRYGIPLALNTPQFTLQFSYRPLLEIPRRTRRTLEDGKSMTVFPRREYIEDLCAFLEKKVGIEKRDLEDKILAEASLIPDLPITLLNEIGEEEYFQWKHLERKWPGIHASHRLKRTYPQGGSGGDLLGYVGPIHSEEIEQVSSELKSLEDYLRQREEGFNPFLPEGFESPKEVEKRTEILYEEAITQTDEVGISGLEKHFEHALRGLRGKHCFEKSRKNSSLALLPGGESKISGQHLKLALSSELQQKAEELLRISENEYFGVDQLWLHGGAIIAMDPITGEIVAMASHPHIEPQLILEKKNSDPNKVGELLCNNDYLRQVWDGRAPPTKEMGPFVSPLTYSSLIELSFHPESKAREAILQMKTLFEAKQLINFISYISAIYEQSPKELVEKIEELDGGEIALSQEPELSEKLISARSFLSQIPKNDRVLVLDFLRLFSSSLSEEFLRKAPSLSFSQMMDLRRAYLPLLATCKELGAVAFKKTIFEEWRNAHFDQFLKEKRKEEKENRHYTKPYTEYLGQEFKRQFKEFWEMRKEKITLALVFGGQEGGSAFWQVLHKEIDLSHPLLNEQALALRVMLTPFQEADRFDLLQCIHPCRELSDPLWGKYRKLRNYAATHPQTLQDLALSFFRPMTSLHRSLSYREYFPQGSIFKLLISYQALIERYHELVQKNLGSSFYLNPLTLIDDNHPKTKKIGDQLLGYFEDRTPIRRLYKGGILPRSSHAGIGKVDLLSALEQSSDLYFSILASDYISSYDALIATTRGFGFGEKTGIELPGEVGGTIPSDLQNNPTNLYSFAIGQHSLTVTPLQTAKMVASFVNGGTLVPPRLCLDLRKRQIDTTYQDEPFDISGGLKALGLPQKFFSIKEKKLRFHYNLKLKERTARNIAMPPIVSHELQEGMRRIVHGSRGTARLASVWGAKLPARIIDLYKTEKNYLIGKTSTAEIILKTTLDHEIPGRIKNHVWFGAIGYDRPIVEAGATPDLVIIVALKYREAGRDAAALAGALHYEWRKLQEGRRKRLHSNAQ